MLEWFRFALGSLFLFVGIVIFCVQLFGIFRYKYVLNRMHAAAMGDTLGISFSLVGLMIFSGLNFVTLKFALVVLFLWCASPVSSHLIARLEVTTNEKLEENCSVETDSEPKMQKEGSDLGKAIEEEKA